MSDYTRFPRRSQRPRPLLNAGQVRTLKAEGYTTSASLTQEERVALVKAISPKKGGRS